MAGAGAGNGFHGQSQTQQMINQVQGSSMSSSQEQKETGPESGPEHRSKGPIQQTGYLQYRSEVHPGDKGGDGDQASYIIAQIRTYSPGLA